MLPCASPCALLSCAQLEELMDIKEAEPQYETVTLRDITFGFASGSHMVTLEPADEFTWGTPTDWWIVRIRNAATGALFYANRRLMEGINISERAHRRKVKT